MSGIWMQKAVCRLCRSSSTRTVIRAISTAHPAWNWSSGNRAAGRFEKRNRNPNAEEEEEDDPRSPSKEKYIGGRNLKPQQQPDTKIIAPSMRNKFRLFQDETEEVLDSAQAQWITIKAPEEESVDEFEGLSLERGQTGVYDIDELVHVLRLENADGICVLSIPAELNFADYMVVASGQSSRQLMGMAQFVSRYYKAKKSPIDPFLNTSAAQWKPSWICLDLGNIILHLMDWESRRIYDIESLWALGPAHDAKLQAPIHPSLEMVQKHSSIVHPTGSLDNGPNKRPMATAAAATTTITSTHMPEPDAASSTIAVGGYGRLAKLAKTERPN
ncbi:putative Mitochondrial assembly of ribosomal large subunit protein 1 [Hypsibius exemplaris]|uniref:Mitochondrial assembly of ribosomal large subunit protein 1 n=1 Tax=Hypsibius exemplaris TaxID=2072580 RepID=A0A1W0WXT5_HYPEX|nr:putative Mitochondrial assembly of ribosomal large subunit protein 1 [Hypsibius exemplaris]